MQRGWGASGGGGTEPGGSGRRACLGAAGSLPAWVLQLSFDLRGSHPPETWGGWAGWAGLGQAGQGQAALVLLHPTHPSKE